MHTAVHLFKAASGPRMSGEARGGRELLIVRLISFSGLITLVRSRKSQRVLLSLPTFSWAGSIRSKGKQGQKELLKK